MKLLPRAIIFIAALFVVGCAAERRPVPQPEPLPEEPRYVYHTVQYSGESLGAIARWYTGSAANWPIIQDANLGLDPRRIRIGQTIQIPESLVTTDRPMPADFIRSGNSSQKSEPKQPDAAVPTPEESATQPEQAVEEVVPAAEPQATEPEVAETVTEEPEEAVPAPTSDTIGALEAAPVVLDPVAAPEDEERDKLLNELLSE